MSKQNKLYLEQRIAAVRKALNENTHDFMDQLPSGEVKHQFKQFILDCLNVLDFGNKEAANRITKT